MKNILKRNIVACYISDVIFGTAFQVPIWIVYQSKFLNFKQIAFFAGLAMIIEVIMQMPTGAFADLFGRRLSLALGNLFMALPMFLIAFFPHPGIMWLYAFMWGLGNAFSMGTSKPIIYDTLKKDGKEELFGKINSRSAAFFQISAALSIALGGYLYQVSSNLPYIVSGFASLIGIFTAFLFIEPKLEQRSFKLGKFISTNKEGFIEIFKNSYMVKLTILFTLILGIAQVSQQFFVQPYMLELGMNDIERGLIAMIIKLIIAFLGVLIISSKKIFKNKLFILIIPILMAVAFIPAKFIALPFAYLVIIGIAFTSGNANVFMTPEVNENISSSVRSTALSAQKMIASFIKAGIQWISALIIVRSSVGTFVTYLGIFSLIIILPLAISVMKHKHRMSVAQNNQELQPHL